MNIFLLQCFFSSSWNSLQCINVAVQFFVSSSSSLNHQQTRTKVRLSSPTWSSKMQKNWLICFSQRLVYFSNLGVIKRDTHASYKTCCSLPGLASLFQILRAIKRLSWCLCPLVVAQWLLSWTISLLTHGSRRVQFQARPLSMSKVVCYLSNCFKSSQNLNGDFKSSISGLFYVGYQTT